MSTITTTPPITPEELLLLPDQVNYELVDGKLVDRTMGMESSRVAANILILIGRYVRQHASGHVFGADAGYQCFVDDAGKVRKPDVSFIRLGRIPNGIIPEGHCRIHPDLAVEVVSPNDTAYELEDKVFEYLQAGVPLIWVIYPPTKTIRIHRPRTSAQGPVSELMDADMITGEDVLPGFTCAVKEFFA
jgi:Uma2 family endonuclease